MTMHTRFLAIFVLHALPLLLLLVTWKRPYAQAKPTMLWGQVIASAGFFFLFPLCFSLDFGGSANSVLSDLTDPLYLLAFWSGEGSILTLLLFSPFVIAGLLLALRKKLRPE